MFHQDPSPKLLPRPPEENMSNLTSASGEASAASSGNQGTQPPPAKKKRNQPGNPDPEAEVIALSPKTLMATNRFVCEICSKRFQRDQNLQLHKRGHNLPWKLKQRSSKEVRKKVYVCPEVGCVHHDPARALGDLTGIKKHFCRKHGEKKWKCERCSKKYAVQSDWKAHSKTCGTREYRCDCGTLFSRKDSFITHRAFCDALAEESARASTSSQQQLHQFSLKNETPPSPLPLPLPLPPTVTSNYSLPPWLFPPATSAPLPLPGHHDFSQNQAFATPQNCPNNTNTNPKPNYSQNHQSQHFLPYSFPASASVSSAHMSATALLQKAAQMGTMPRAATVAPCSSSSSSTMAAPHYSASTDVGRSGGDSSSSGLSSRDHQQGKTMMAASGFVHGQSSLGSKAAAGGGPPPSSAALLREAVATTSIPTSATGFAGPSWVDAAFGSHNATMLGTKGERGGGGGGEDLTRDFLGLGPLSHSDIMSMAGLGGCMDTTSPRHASSQEPWQG